MRYTVTCEGAPVGHVDLPPLETWDHGSADGTLEPLPAFDPFRLRLEAALRAAFLMDDRIAAAQRDGWVRPEPPPSMTLESESQQITIREITPEELAIMGADAMELVADAERITFNLLEADGQVLPANLQVYVTVTRLPEWPGPDHQPSVTVVVPRPDDEDDASEAEA